MNTFLFSLIRSPLLYHPSNHILLYSRIPFIIFKHLRLNNILPFSSCIHSPFILISSSFSFSICRQPVLITFSSNYHLSDLLYSILPFSSSPFIPFLPNSSHIPLFVTITLLHPSYRSPSSSTHSSLYFLLIRLPLHASSP